MTVPVWEGLGQFTYYFAGAICIIGTIIAGYMLAKVILTK